MTHLPLRIAIASGTFLVGAVFLLTFTAWRLERSQELGAERLHARWQELDGRSKAFRHERFHCFEKPARALQLAVIGRRASGDVLLPDGFEMTQFATLEQSMAGAFRWMTQTRPREWVDAASDEAVYGVSLAQTDAVALVVPRPDDTGHERFLWASVSRLTDGAELCRGELAAPTEANDRSIPDLIGKAIASNGHW